VIEVASGRPRTRIETDKDASINALAFSPDGRTLAASVYGGPLFLWDLYAGAECEAIGFDLPGAWACLGGDDAAAAFLAVRGLIQKGAPAVAYLGTRLRPVPAPDAKRLAGHVADLDHRDFRKREAAFNALRDLGERAHDALRQAMASGPSPEVRERIDKLLAEDERPSGDELRQLRAVEVVEHVGGPDARKLLAHGASGAAGTRFTLEAAAAAKRLGGRLE
jgi:hypothetical protein